jgi:hypothetical protein
VIWRVSQAEPAPPPAGPSTTTAPDAANRTTGDSLLESRAATEPGAIAPRPFRDPDAVAATTAASRPAQDGRLLAVLLEPDDAPAAGAVVDLTPLGTNASSPGCPVKGLVADAEGIVRLPTFKGYAEVHGSLGEKCGRTELFAGSLRRFELQLGPGVPVVVVDAGGAPQEGVPVVTLSRDAWTRVLDHAVTGADGVARLTPPSERDAGRDRTGQALVALGLPLEEPVEALFDRNELPETPLKLVLPATGRIVVRLVAAGGQPFTGAAMVEIQGPDRGLRVNDRGPDLVRVAADAGVATFPHVGLEPRLEVRAIPADPALRSVSGTIGGPRMFGPTPITLECGGLATLVSGRFVRPGGKPIPRADAELRIGRGIVDPSDRKRAARVTTSSDGRFLARFDFDPATLDFDELTIGIEAEKPVATGRGYVERLQEIAVPIPQWVRTGVSDIGDVVVPELMLVASGKVVDQAGKPVGGAKVIAVKRLAAGWFRTEDDLEAGTTADGRFTLKGRAEGSALLLAAERDAWLCVEPTPCDVGARDVTVTMTRAGGIAGSIAAFEAPLRSVWARSPRMEVWLVRAGANVQRTRHHGGGGALDRVAVDVEGGSGEFEHKSVLPGTWTVEFYSSAQGRKAPLLAFDGVVVKAGETTRDPRLQNVDLSKVLKSRGVTVFDENGRPLKDVRVGARAAGSQARFGLFVTESDGKASIMSNDDTLELVATLEGYQSATVAAASGDTTLTLRRTEPKHVTIKLADGVEIPPAPFSIGVELDFVAPLGEKVPPDAVPYDPRNTGERRADFGRDRTVTIDVYDTGVYAIQVWLNEGVLRGRSGIGLVDYDNKPTVVVHDDGGSATVSIDADVLKERMRRKKE